MERVVERRRHLVLTQFVDEGAVSCVVGLVLEFVEAFGDH